MAPPRKTGEPARPEATVSRTYRAAIRIGEDYITLEETIVLPLDASDEEVAKAVDLGWRIYRTQREAIEAQIAGIREAQPAPPAFVLSQDQTLHWMGGAGCAPPERPTRMDVTVQL